MEEMPKGLGGLGLPSAMGRRSRHLIRVNNPVSAPSSDSESNSGRENYTEMLQLAQQKRQEGSEAMAAKQYRAACDAYASAVDSAQRGLQAAGSINSSEGIAACRIAASTLFSNMRVSEACFRLADNKGVLDCAQKSLFCNARNLQSWTCMASALESQGKTDAAVAACQQALTVADPDNDMVEDMYKLLQKLLDKLTGSLSASASQTPVMVAVCASHITSDVRFACLERIIRSWVVQEHPVPLYLSLSFDSANLTAAEQAARQQALQHQYPGLTVTLRDQPLKESEHYQQLVQELAQQYDSKQTWLVFSDDDDTWHPQRTVHYVKELLAASDALPDTMTVYSKTRAFHDNRGTAKHAQNLLHGPWELPVKPHNILGRGEYWDHCTRLCTAQQFFASCSADLLQHKYWDLCFRKFLSTGHSYNTVSFQPECWMYCYTQSKDSITGGDAAARMAHMAAGNWGKVNASLFREDLEVLCSDQYEFADREYKEDMHVHRHEDPATSVCVGGHKERPEGI